MPSEQDIRDQLEQLQLLRENVQFFRRQALAHGGLAAAPVATQRGLASAYAEIARCKAVLRGWGMPVEDLLDDVAPPNEAEPLHPHPAGTTLPDPASTLTPRQRAELLDRLALRYRELLDHALAHQVRLQLGLHTRPDAVDPAWRRLLLRGPLASQAVPLDTPLLELFDHQQGQLLVLGAPGAGKTTLIVELAQALTKRAQADGQARIPVVLNIAAWRSGQSLRDWLQRALRDVLGASRRFAAQLADGDDLLLLLDGVDEVAADHRAACVAAITAYLGERDLAPPLVVGCRSREFADLGTRLPIAGAVELEPLELPAIERGLEGVPAAAGVLAALQTDEVLRELTSTPLMVNVLLLAHGGQEVPAVKAQTLDEHRRALWWAYVRRMLVQRPLSRLGRALHYLRWLAQQMRRQSETNFLVDGLQPNTVPSTKLCWYKGIKASVDVVIIGTLGVMVVGQIEGLLEGLSKSLVIGLIGGSGFALVGTILGIEVSRVIIRLFGWPVEREIRQPVPLMVGTLLGWVGMVMIHVMVGELLKEMVIVLIVGLVGGLLDGGEDSATVLLAPVVASIGFGVVGLLLGGLGLGVILVLAGMLFGICYGELGRGLGELFQMFIQHYLSRLILWRADLFPFRAVTFLEAMTERLLLERDGALYRFRHLLLRDFIADLSDEEIDELARGL